MFNARAIVLTSALIFLPSCRTQSTTFTYGAAGCSGLLANDGHCCPGSVINAGSSSAICCAGDPNYDLINSSGVSLNVEGGITGNGVSAGNSINGPSTCTAGTSTALSALPSTASGNSGSASQTSGVTTTTTTQGSQVCVSTTDASGNTSQSCHGAGDQGSGSGSPTTSASPNGNTIVSGANSGVSSSSASSSSSSSSHNAAWRPAATSAPLLVGVMAGAVALL